MSDLTDKYFRQDLTEAERQALREELLSSDNAAERFGERAEEVYKALGLPEPHWTGPDHFRPASKYGFWKWLGLGMLFLGGMGTFGWFLLSGNWMSRSVISPPLLEVTPALKAVPQLSKQLKPREETNEPLTVARAEVSAPQKNLAPLTVPVPTFTPVPLAPPSTALTLLRPKFTPVNVDQNPSGQFSSLSVILRRPTAGTISVRVLDSNGAEIIPLYNGNLPAGSWAFSWNGLLRNGLLAPPGKYRIEVRAGSWVQVKDVLVQK